MEKNLYIVLFVVGFLIFLGTMGVNVPKLVFKVGVRCLLGIVIIAFVDYFLPQFDENLIVNINEISIGACGILGIWGVILLFALQYYFTIT